MATAVALAGAAVAAAAFSQAFVRLRRRGRTDLAGWDRAALFGAGLVLGVLALSPPMDRAADRLLAAHMLEHLVIGDLVPALLLTAVRGPLLFFLLPPPLLRTLARLRALRALGRTLLRPGVSLAVWALSLAVWHVPALYDRTLESAPLHALQHGSFVLGGMLVWAQLIDPAGRNALPQRLRLGYALVLFVAGQALANTLILAYRPLYPAYAAQPHRLFGFSPLGDQDAAGLVMMGEQLATLGTFAAIQLRRWLRAPLVPQAARHPFAA